MSAFLSRVWRRLTGWFCLQQKCSLGSVSDELTVSQACVFLEDAYMVSTESGACIGSVDVERLCPGA